MAGCVLREWLIGVITPRLSLSPSLFSTWSVVSSVMEESESKVQNSETRVTSEPDTQIDLTNVSCHRVRALQHRIPDRSSLDLSLHLEGRKANNDGDQCTPSNESVSPLAVILRPIVADDAPTASTCMVRRITSFRPVSLTRNNKRNHCARYPRFEV